MEPDSTAERRMTFLIRLEGDRGGLRGQVIAVGTGAARLFDDLAGAVAFIEAQVRGVGADAETGQRRPTREITHPGRRPGRAEEVSPST